MLAKFWRPVPCDIWDRIADHDHLAQRLYLWLWTGPASQQCGLSILRDYEAAGALRTKPVMVQQALRALESDGLLTVQPAARGRSIVWLDRYLSGQTPVKPEHRLSVLSDIQRHDVGNAVTQALEDWDIWDAASRQPVGRQGAASVHRTKQNRTEQNTPDKNTKSIPYGMQAAPSSAPDAGSWTSPDEPPASWFDTPTPAPTPATPKRAESPLLIRNPHLRALKGLDPLPEEPQPVASQPEPEPADDEIPEWAPKAAAQAAAPEAVSPAVQTTLDLRPPKRKELTDKQRDAIFAKQQMAKWVKAWNENMARVCIPAATKDMMPSASKLMGNLARLVNRDNPTACPTELLKWAKENSDYHNGKKGRKWSLKAWLSADHIGQLFADYREHKDAMNMHRPWRFMEDRTLTDWRQAVEDEADRIARMNSTEPANDCA